MRHGARQRMGNSVFDKKVQWTYQNDCESLLQFAWLRHRQLQRHVMSPEISLLVHTPCVPHVSDLFELDHNYRPHLPPRLQKSQQVNKKKNETNVPALMPLVCKCSCVYPSLATFNRKPTWGNQHTTMVPKSRVLEQHYNGMGDYVETWIEATTAQYL